MVPDLEDQTLPGHARHLGNAVKKLFAARCGNSHLNAFVAADARRVDQQQEVLRLCPPPFTHLWRRLVRREGGEEVRRSRWAGGALVAGPDGGGTPLSKPARAEILEVGASFLETVSGVCIFQLP